MLAHGYFLYELRILEGSSGTDQGYFMSGSLGNFLKFKNGAQSNTLSLPSIFLLVLSTLKKIMNFDAITNLGSSCLYIHYKGIIFFINSEWHEVHVALEAFFSKKI